MTQKARTARRHAVRQPAVLTMTDESRRQVQSLDQTGVQFLRIDDNSRAVFHQLLQKNKA